MMLIDSLLRTHPLLIHHLVVLDHSLMLVDVLTNLYWWRWLRLWRDITIAEMPLCPRWDSPLSSKLLTLLQHPFRMMKATILSRT